MRRPRQQRAGAHLQWSCPHRRCRWGRCRRGRCAGLIFRACHPDRKSTRLNSSHLGISYAVFCLKKKMTEFELLADARSAEALSDALLAAGALSVSVEDADAQSDREQPIYAEPDRAAASAWRLNRLRVLLGPGYQADEVLRQASASLDLAPPQIAAVRPITDQDWVKASQSQFSPIQIGRLWIVPSWIDS